MIKNFNLPITDFSNILQNISFLESHFMQLNEIKRQMNNAVNKATQFYYVEKEQDQNWIVCTNKKAQSKILEWAWDWNTFPNGIESEKTYRFGFFAGPHDLLNSVAPVNQWKQKFAYWHSQVRRAFDGEEERTKQLRKILSLFGEGRLNTDTADRQFQCLHLPPKQLSFFYNRHPHIIRANASTALKELNTLYKNIGSEQSEIWLEEYERTKLLLKSLPEDTPLQKRLSRTSPLIPRYRALFDGEQSKSGIAANPLVLLAPSSGAGLENLRLPKVANPSIEPSRRLTYTTPISQILYHWYAYKPQKEKRAISTARKRQPTLKTGYTGLRITNQNTIISTSPSGQTRKINLKRYSIDDACMIAAEHYCSERPRINSSDVRQKLSKLFNNCSH